MSESKRSDEEVGESSDEEWVVEGERCLVSDPALPHYLSRRTGKDTKHDCFFCGKRRVFSWPIDTFHYYCTICKVEFHSMCYHFPSKMIHPYHPQHPLTFTYLNEESETIVDANIYEDTIESFRRTSEIISGCSVMFNKCTWCRDNLGGLFHRCQICNFALDLSCAKQRPPLTIQDPKSHHHSLFLFPRPLSFPCNACGLIKVTNVEELGVTDRVKPGYACYQCNYVVHQHCIELPRVIKITRHPHRLSYTPYLPIRLSSCRVCYTNVDIKYGQYSCNHGDCSYVAHSKCATHKNVWGGKELEWVPEVQEEAIEPPYKKVGDGLIEHFCHDHHYLKLEKYNSARDSWKQCQACIRSIISQDFYNCIECNYFLHELCANLPRKMDHLLHIHSLFLDTCPLENRDIDKLRCRVCWRETSGWKYVCTEDGCPDSFKVDVNCILVQECFTHESHAEHPLFISTTGEYPSKTLCQGCKNRFDSMEYRLNCTICEFVLCFECITIPKEIYYKYDERPLSLCYGESGVDNKYWCELCEKNLDPTNWFYTNKELCTTIHLTCLFGDAFYMKAGHTFNYSYKTKKVVVVGNGSSTRPICYKCHQRCAQPVYFKMYKEDETEVYYCSFYCTPPFYV